MSNAVSNVHGLEVRRLAADLLRNCRDTSFTVEEAMAGQPRASALEARDRALLSNLLLTVFRHHGEIAAVLGRLLDKPLPRKSGRAREMLEIGVAQLLFLDMPPHAVIDLAVRSAKADRNALHFSGLVNAVLRKVAGSGTGLRDGLDAARINTPDWLWSRWEKSYGPDQARSIGLAHAARPSLDLNFRTGAAPWVERLAGTRLPNGQLRLAAGHAPVTELPGFAEGEWWVQDAAATIPARLLGDIRGRHVLDLCAAPGGKTLQLAAAGAFVTALDVSEQRLERLRANLARTGLTARIVAADLLSVDPSEIDPDVAEGWDGVLLDAPCSATGTIRRHPELPWLKSEVQMQALSGLQRRLLDKAARLVAPGGTLIYCTCSLEPEEGERQVARFLARSDGFELVPAELPAYPPEAVAEEGWVRTLPSMSLGGSPGMDGFFAAALRRRH